MDNFKENNDNKENHTELIGDAEAIEKETPEENLESEKENLQESVSNQDNQSVTDSNSQGEKSNHSYNYNSDEEKNRKDIKPRKKRIKLSSIIYETRRGTYLITGDMTIGKDVSTSVTRTR